MEPTIPPLINFDRNKNVNRILNPNPLTGNPGVDSLDIEGLLARNDMGQNPSLKKVYRWRLQVLLKSRAIDETNKISNIRAQRKLARRQRRLEHTGGMKSESARGEMSDSHPSNNDVHQNVTEHGGEATKIVSLGKPASKPADGGVTQYELSKFFERPVSIYDTTLATASELNVAINPWDLWSLDNTVRAKLSNYAYFRGTLHVRISVTATPYHYGILMASYQAYARYNSVLGAYDDAISDTTPGATMLPLYKTYLSQSPGVTYLNVTENQPTEMIIPFISHKSKFRLFNGDNNVLTNVTPYQDFEEAGEIRLTTINQLQIANSDFDSAASINVYAWVTDIDLGAITATNINVTAEARRRRRKPESVAKEIRETAEELEDELSEDEYERDYGASEGARRRNWDATMQNKPAYDSSLSITDRIGKTVESAGTHQEPGPVATVASAVANVGDTLSTLPVIGGVAATASSLARGIGKVASWFGFARPIVLEDTSYVKHITFSGGANTTGKVTAQKLTMDPNQELSLDASLGGLDKDSMGIQYIAGTESFFTTFTWEDGDAAMTSVLWSAGVTPWLVKHLTYSTASNSRTIYQPTSCAFAVQPFMYWRGTMRYRFEIVCSRFHRGKLLFTFDPNFAQHVLISSNATKLNQQNTTVLDIQDAREIVFDIEWAHPRQWASLDRTSSTWDEPLADMPDVGDTADTTAMDASAYNGFIEVRPINELVQPTSTSDVHVNVYVSCPDLEVNRMHDLSMPQQRIMYSEASRDSSHTEPHEGAVIETMGYTGASTKDNSLFLHHFGERHASFRNLLKRYVTMSIAIGSEASSALGVYKATVPLYPTRKLRMDSSDSSNNNFNPLYSYLRHAYMGVRGGTRYRVGWISDKAPVPQTLVRVVLDDPTNTVTTSDLSISSESVAASSNFLEHFSGTNNGSILYATHVDGGIEFEIPYYSDNLFAFAFGDDLGDGVADDPANGYRERYSPSATVNVAYDFGSTGNEINVFSDFSTAEDFTFLRYNGAPFWSTA